MTKTNTKQKIQEIFATEELIDKYFPKGDKRRGEVLALISVLNAKVQKEIDVFVKEILEEIDPMNQHYLNIIKNKIIKRYSKIKLIFIDKDRSKINPKVRKRDNYKCCFCGKDVFKINEEIGGGNTIHHIIPKRYGGKVEERNLITICGYCHHRLEKYLNVVEKKTMEFTLNYCKKIIKQKAGELE